MAEIYTSPTANRLILDFAMRPLTKELGKLALNAVQAGYVMVATKARFIDFPVPPNSSMRKTSSKTISHYYLSGIRCYLPIATMALHYGIELDRDISILDFGCGVARELLHFQRHYPNPKYFACDVDATSVDYVRKTFRVECYKNEFEPPLRYEASSMDMIYSVSTFSHLSPADHMPWLRELCRVTKPGQFCFLTTEGSTAFQQVKEEASLEASDETQFYETGVLYKEYPTIQAERHRRYKIPVANLAMGITGSYGNTVLLPDHIRSAWPSSGFDVIDIIEGIIDHRQDLVVLRKSHRS
jgi:SAM-dependent methyltransferase